MSLYRGAINPPQEAALHRCSYKEVFWKHTENLLENTHAEVRFQQSYKATLLKSHFGMFFFFHVNILPVFRTPFLRTPLEDCFHGFWIRLWLMPQSLNEALVWPYNHTACISRWNDVETVIYTSFQHGIQVACLSGCYEIIC